MYGSIRQTLHPQFVDLWSAHPALRTVEDNRHFPKGGTSFRQKHHTDPGAMIVSEWRGKGGELEILDLFAPIDKHGAWFRPLVRDSHALHCGLKVLFLRKEQPGKIYQGGDIDGRIKTLLDALSMPQHAEQIVERTSSQSSPIYCLLQDDFSVSGLEVQSERLLTDQNHPSDFVRLVIEVDVRVRQAMIYNQSFLG